MPQLVLPLHGRCIRIPVVVMICVFESRLPWFGRRLGLEVAINILQMFLALLVVFRTFPATTQHRLSRLPSHESCTPPILAVIYSTASGFRGLPTGDVTPAAHGRFSTVVICCPHCFSNGFLSSPLPRSFRAARYPEDAVAPGPVAIVCRPAH